MRDLLNRPTYQEHENVANILTWNINNTKLLLDRYMAQVPNFRNPKVKKSTVWQTISREMNERGYSVTPDICDKKFRNLKITYKKMKETKQKTGRARQHWEYFDIMDEIFKEDATINPPMVISTLKRPLPQTITPAPYSILPEIVEPLPSTSGASYQVHQSAVAPSTSAVHCSPLGNIVPTADVGSTPVPIRVETEVDPLLAEEQVPPEPVRSRRCSLNTFRSKMLEIEERKLRTLEGMLQSMNDRNELIREYLQKKQ